MCRASCGTRRRRQQSRAPPCTTRHREGAVAAAPEKPSRSPGSGPRGRTSRLRRGPPRASAEGAVRQGRRRAGRKEGRRAGGRAGFSTHSTRVNQHPCPRGGPSGVACTHRPPAPHPVVGRPRRGGIRASGRHGRRETRGKGARAGPAAPASAGATAGPEAGRDAWAPTQRPIPLLGHTPQTRRPPKHAERQKKSSPSTPRHLPFASRLLPLHRPFTSVTGGPSSPAHCPNTKKVVGAALLLEECHFRFIQLR